MPKENADKQEPGQKGRQVVTVEEVERVLAQLPGVTAVRLVVSDWGAVEEIHVLGTTERPAKNIVRDIESCLTARWGLTVDHKRISVAQLVPRQPSPAALRVRLLSVQVVNEAAFGRCTVKVVLGVSASEVEEGSLFTSEGEARGATNPLVSGRIVCEATVGALNQLVDPGWVFAAEGWACTWVGRTEVAVVTLALLTPRGTEETLVGAVPIKGDRVEAFVRATLDAANRRLGKTAGRPVRRHLEPAAGAGEQEMAEDLCAATAPEEQDQGKTGTDMEE